MDLEAVKDRLNRKFRGEWMDSIYPGLSLKEQRLAFGRDLLVLGRAVRDKEGDPKLIADMTEPELRDYFGGLARTVEAELPPGPSRRGKCLFVLIVADTCEPGVGQYVANMERSGCIKLLRETADRLEGREDIPR